MSRLHINLILVIFMLLILAGCSSFNSLSDRELVKIVKSYYSYYYSEKRIDMAVFERGKYKKQCDCFPVKFTMFLHKEPKINKTLYFYKSESGRFEVRELENGFKFISN